MLSSLTLNLPFPNSANTHWRHGRGMTYVSKQGTEYRKQVKALTNGVKMPEGRLEMHVTLHAPTKRAYDIDNRLKPLGDALQLAGVFEDDGLIDKITVERGQVIKGGKCLVTLTLRNP